MPGTVPSAAAPSAAAMATAILVLLNPRFIEENSLEIKLTVVSGGSLSLARFARYFRRAKLRSRYENDASAAGDSGIDLRLRRSCRRTKSAPMQEVIGLFPTPFMRLPRTLAPELV